MDSFFPPHSNSLCSSFYYCLGRKRGKKEKKIISPPIPFGRIPRVFLHRKSSIKCRVKEKEQRYERQGWTKKGTLVKVHGFCTGFSFLFCRMGGEGEGDIFGEEGGGKVRNKRGIRVICHSLFCTRCRS